MIIIDTYGMCALWGVDFNALTLINLIAAIGLSIEFTGGSSWVSTLKATLGFNIESIIKIYIKLFI